jgi:radical SAM protein with 4Fe4S-binding SPASM domain
LGDVWHDAPLLEELRDRDRLRGRCGPCLYRFHCGGCRAIAYGATGDHLSEDPQCWYESEGLRARIRSFFKG